MKICDICKSDNVKYNAYATITDNGSGRSLELCGCCYTELQTRTKHHEHLAYIETVKAINGEIPRKSHWWDRLKERMI